MPVWCITTAESNRIGCVGPHNRCAFADSYFCLVLDDLEPIPMRLMRSTCKLIKGASVSNRSIRDYEHWRQTDDFYLLKLSRCRITSRLGAVVDLHVVTVLHVRSLTATVGRSGTSRTALNTSF